MSTDSLVSPFEWHLVRADLDRVDGGFWRTTKVSVDGMAKLEGAIASDPGAGFKNGQVSVGLQSVVPMRAGVRAAVAPPQPGGTLGRSLPGALASRRLRARSPGTAITVSTMPMST